MRIPVGVLGASGLVGEVLIDQLRRDERMDIRFLGASDRRVGETLASDLPPLSSIVPDSSTPDLRLVFSALPKDVARRVEPLWAKVSFVVSNASAFRDHPGVPLIIPEINPHHLRPAIEAQRRDHSWRGLVTNPNCAAIPLTMALAPLADLHPEVVCVTSFQALSGAGRDGPIGLDVIDNVLPVIPGEAQKIETEPLKILGESFAGLKISATTARVPVRVGHLLSIRIGFRSSPRSEDLVERWTESRGLRQTPACPTPLVFTDCAPRPADLEPRDLRVLVGGLSTDPIFDFQLWALADNLARGAAHAAWLNALLVLEEFDD